MKIKLTDTELDEIIHAFELVDGEYNFTDNQRDLYNKLVGMRKSQEPKDLHELKPCPFCGCDNVFQYAGMFFVYIECAECGVTFKHSSACVLYHKSEVPEKLIGVKTYEPELLSIRDKDGNIINCPEPGYVGVNAIDALKAYGSLDRWNRRV